MKFFESKGVICLYRSKRLASSASKILRQALLDGGNSLVILFPPQPLLLSTSPRWTPEQVPRCELKLRLVSSSLKVDSLVGKKCLLLQNKSSQTKKVGRVRYYF